MKKLQEFEKGLIRELIKEKIQNWEKLPNWMSHPGINDKMKLYKDILEKLRK